MRTDSLWSSSVTSKYNVMGEGETVAIIDTGIDLGSCYFANSTNTFNAYQPWNDKVVYYNTAVGDSQEGSSR